MEVEGDQLNNLMRHLISDNKTYLNIGTPNSSVVSVNGDCPGGPADFDDDLSTSGVILVVL